MTLSLSTTLTHITIDESAIIDIYRSTQPVTPPDAMYGGHPCEAYFCTGRENSQMLAYVAILDTTTKVPFIFTDTCDGKDAAACRQLMAEANERIVSLGFSLKKIAIDYGVAMRQVIIRNLRIMRPPERTRTSPTPQKQVPSGEKSAVPAGTTAEAPKQHGAAAQQRHVPAPSDSLSVEPCRDDNSVLSMKLSALQAAFDRIAQEKSEAETSAGQTIAELTTQLEQATAACTKAENAARENLAHYRQADDARLDEIEQLGSAFKLAAEARLEAQDTLSSERDQHRKSEARATGEIARREAELKEERVRSAALEKRLLEAEDGLHEAGSALEAEIKRRSENETTAKKRERLLRKELGTLRDESSATKALLRDSEEQYQALLEEHDQLRARLSEAVETAVRPEEQGAREAALMRELEQTKAAYQAVAGQLEEAKTERDLAMEALEAELHAADEKVALLAADVERLSSEKLSWDFDNASFKNKVRSAVERAGKEKQVLQEELHRLREQLNEGPLSAAPVKADFTEPDIPRSLVMAEADAESPRAADKYSMGSSWGAPGSAFQSGDSVFRHDPKLATISCHSSDDIIEIHGAINAIQAGPFGKKSQVCRAYVMGMRHGKKTSVYLAWLLQEERCVLVCKPEKQPENAAGYAAIMRDAIFYFESTGLMMDSFDLSKGAQHQLKALEESGICRLGGYQAPQAATG